MTLITLLRILPFTFLFLAFHSKNPVDYCFGDQPVHQAKLESKKLQTKRIIFSNCKIPKLTASDIKRNHQLIFTFMITEVSADQLKIDLVAYLKSPSGVHIGPLELEADEKTVEIPNFVVFGNHILGETKRFKLFTDNPSPGSSSREKAPDYLQLTPSYVPANNQLKITIQAYFPDRRDTEQREIKSVPGKVIVDADPSPPASISKKLIPKS